MSVADEIEKLNALRMQKIISEAEFEQQKKTLLAGSGKKKSKISFFKRKSVRIFMGCFGLLILINTLQNVDSKKNSSAKDSSGEIPACDSENAIGALQNAVEHNATGNIDTLKLLDTKNLRQISYDSNKNSRKCSGVLILNSGRESVQYELTESSTGNLLVEVTPIN